MLLIQSCATDVPIETKEFKLGDVMSSESYPLHISGGIFYFDNYDTLRSARITIPSNSFTIPKTLTLTKTRIAGSSLTKSEEKTLKKITKKFKDLIKTDLTFEELINAALKIGEVKVPKRKA